MFQCLIPAFFERGSVSFGETPVPWEIMSSTLLLPEQPANTVPKNTVPKPAALAKVELDDLAYLLKVAAAEATKVKLMTTWRICWRSLLPRRRK